MDLPVQTNVHFLDDCLNPEHLFELSIFLLVDEKEGMKLAFVLV
jgi:hypothetical protein